VLYEDVPVAELRFDRSSQEYVFTYLDKFAEMGLKKLPELPFGQEHRRTDLFRFFKERIPDLCRPEVAGWLQQHAMNKNDQFELLTALGSKSVTDSFQLRRVA
jgi:HipA-like protein